jgi:hypothetical protein
LRKGSKSLGVIDLVAWIAVNAKKGLKLPIVLSGDTHHYSRYTGDDGVTQFITSGGGGAFLHPTHQLAPTIDINRESDGFSWLGGRVKTLTLGTDPDPDAGPAPNESLYPTRRDSIAMLAGNFEFVRYNAGFAALLGVLYWLVGLATQHLWPDVLYLAPVVLCLGFWLHPSAGRRRPQGARRIARQRCHPQRHRDLAGAVFPVGQRTLVAAAGLAAGRRDAVCRRDDRGRRDHCRGVGLYLYVASHWWRLNHNDAFSAMRRDSHRNFLRLQIKGDEVTIYPVGLDRSPRRREWRENTARAGSPAPAFVPTTPLDPRLIEGPIVVRS